MHLDNKPIIIIVISNKHVTSVKEILHFKLLCCLLIENFLVDYFQSTIQSLSQSINEVYGFGFECFIGFQIFLLLTI